MLDIEFRPITFQQFKFITKRAPKPKHDDLIVFLSKEFDSDNFTPEPVDGIVRLLLPDPFSLTDNFSQTFNFIKALFNNLYWEVNKIWLDYSNVKQLDVDASACMDVILSSYNSYFQECRRKLYPTTFQEVTPLNFPNDPEILKLLFSVGAYNNLRGYRLKGEHGIIPFTLRIGDSKNDRRGKVKEVHETEIVDYVITCLEHCGQQITADAESHLSKVVGEVMANAEEHSDFRFRYAIGYFYKPSPLNNFVADFRLVIFNFGQTIYQSFKRHENDNREVIQRMKQLSSAYTKSGLFRPAIFEEESLWTLYSLQEGVTSVKDWRRGKGTIRFIDRFFKLRDNSTNANATRMHLISGHTHIIFDGAYPLIEVTRGVVNRKYQMMTFNTTGNIEELPDDKYVKFVSTSFPGTIIAAKISLTGNNLEKTLENVSNN